MSSNYYACLSLPPCQVEEHENNTPPEPTVTFIPTSDGEPTVPTDTANKTAQRWARRLAKRKTSHQLHASTHETVANAYELLPSPKGYVIGNDDDILCPGIADVTMSSTVVDSVRISTHGYL